MKFGISGATTATVVVAALLASTAISSGSSHREAPGITETPKIDGTDFYMFRSYAPNRDKFVTFLANYIPDQGPYSGPNYFTMDPDAVYEIHVDNDGDAVEDLTFQFDFDNSLSNKGKGISLDIGGKNVTIPLRTAGQITTIHPATQNDTENYSLTLVEGDRRSGKSTVIKKTSGGTTFQKPIDNIGLKTIPDYSIYAQKFIFDIDIPGCSTDGRVFVGQRAEAFAVNLGRIFDLVNFVPIEGDSAPGTKDGKGFPGGITQSRDNDDLVGKSNVTSLALEIPISCLVDKKNGNDVIGAWTTASLPQQQVEDSSPTYESNKLFGGVLVQKSRLSAPLVNEVVIGLDRKDLFNAAEPTQDGALATFVTNPTFPALLNILFKDAVNDTLGLTGDKAIKDLAPTNFPRKDLVAAFLTGFAGVNQQKKVTPSEMMRLNTAIPVTPRSNQKTLGVLAADLAGFPNGRRPGDDAGDIALRVVMGALCYPIKGVTDAKDPKGTLGLCSPKDASVGNVPFTDGAPIRATELQNAFPYLNTPLPGSSGNLGRAIGRSASGRTTSN